MPRPSVQVRRDGESGAVTITAAFVIAGLVTVLLVVLAIAAAATTRHRAQSAADLAALAGAQRAVLGYDDACTVAETVARQNRAALTSCTRAGDDIVVTIRRTVELPVVGSRSASAAARAGP